MMSASIARQLQFALIGKLGEVPGANLGLVREYIALILDAGKIT